MEYRHADKDLEQLESNLEYNAGLAENLVTAFRKRIQQIHDARHENDLRALKSLRFERLKGKRKHQYSIRLNDQFRLVFEIEKAKGGNILVIQGIEDYH